MRYLAENEIDQQQNDSGRSHEMTCSDNSVQIPQVNAESQEDDDPEHDGERLLQHGIGQGCGCDGEIQRAGEKGENLRFESVFLNALEIRT